jgi:hypothetical protein
MKSLSRFLFLKIAVICFLLMPVLFLMQGCSKDDNSKNSYILVENNAGVLMTYFEGGGATFNDVYNGEITDKKKINSGQQTFTWSFGGSVFSCSFYVNEDYSYDLLIQDTNGTYFLVKGPNED